MLPPMPEIWPYKIPKARRWEDVVSRKQFWPALLDAFVLSISGNESGPDRSGTLCGLEAGFASAR